MATGNAGKGSAPLGVSRVSKRPRRRAQSGLRGAQQLLSERQVVERLRLDPASLAALRQCSTKPPRNAAAMVSAIRTRLEWSQAKPTSTLDVNVTTHSALVAEAAKSGDGE